MFSFNPRQNDYIQSIIIADVTLEKIRVGSIHVPELDDYHISVMALSEIGQLVADRCAKRLETYNENAPLWMSVIHEVDAIPYVSIENARRAIEWHDYVLIEGEIPHDSPLGCAERIGKTVLGDRPVYLVTSFSSIEAPAIAKAINHACNIIPGFEPIVQGYRVSTASTLVDALETLNERHYVGVVMRNPSDEDKRMMKAARVRFREETDRRGDPIAVIGYNTIPHPFAKRELQAIAKHF